MLKDNSCHYCTKTPSLKDIMIEITPMQVSTLYLYREQSHKGRCVLAYKDHVRELFELDAKELELYMQDVTKAAAAINKALSADKMNFGVFSDEVPHLHFHLVPKYKGGYEWGSTFAMMPPKPIFLSDAEYAEIIGCIKKELK
jgi:ATP adenylyltransferase